MDVHVPVGAKDSDGTHSEKVVAGFNFTVSLQFPGLLGTAKSRAAAKNVFSKWRAKVRQRNVECKA